MSKISKTKWAYVAAMLEAEGHISITRHLQSYGKEGKKYWLIDCKIGISNISIPLMDWLEENFGGSYRPGGQHNGRRICYRWNLDKYHIQEKFLLGVLPYMLIKREQALLALEFVRMKDVKNPKRRLEISVACQALNAAESPTTNTPNKDVLPYPNVSDMAITLKIESELTGDRKSEPVVKPVSAYAAKSAPLVNELNRITRTYLSKTH